MPLQMRLLKPRASEPQQVTRSSTSPTSRRLSERCDVTVPTSLQRPRAPEAAGRSWYGDLGVAERHRDPFSKSAVEKIEAAGTVTEA